MGSQNNLIAGELLYTTAKSKDANGNDEYIGLALPGTAKTASKWQIKKLTYDAGGFITDIQFAGGSADFNFVWNDRTGYVYS